MALPRMLRVRQLFTAPTVEDIPAAVRSEVQRLDLSGKINPGESVAISVGSRGIAVGGVRLPWPGSPAEPLSWRWRVSGVSGIMALFASSREACAGLFGQSARRAAPQVSNARPCRSCRPFY